jgi:uncharacterized repeat protein (TIGR01451 family)
MAFKPGNTLFAVNTDDELYSMSTVDASTIFLCDVASGSGGGLALNPVDGFLYHYTFNTFERIDDTTPDPLDFSCGVTNIPLMPTTTPGLFNTGLTFRTTTGEFLFAEDSSELYTLSAAGQGPDFVADTLAQSRGLAFVPGDSTSGNPVTLLVEPGIGDAGVFPITITVNDNGTPQLDDFEVFTLTVNPVPADISVSKIVDVPTPLPGDPITYTIVVTNNGPADATGLMINDMLPAGVTHTGNTPEPGTTYNPGTGVWDIGSLLNGATATLTIDATVDSTTVGIVDNTATRTPFDQPDLNSANDSSSAQIDVPPICGLNILTPSFTLGPGTITPGNPASGTFDIQNMGTGTLAVSFDVGTDSTGGLGDANGRHIFPSDIDIDGINMEDGIPVFVVNLVAGTPNTLTMTAQTNNLQNLPAAGTQSGVLTLTGDICS